MFQPFCRMASLAVNASYSILSASVVASLPILTSGFLLCPEVHAQPPAPITLVPSGATWAYLDNGSDQGTAWREPGFDDSGWSRGPAELGYGDGGEATVIRCDPNPDDGCQEPMMNIDNFITTYFRTTFDVADRSQLSEPGFLLRIDDGAVIYLNGTEVGRLNLPDGPIDYLTRTPVAITETLVPIDPTTYGNQWVYDTATTFGALVDGINVLAVEVHQNVPQSSDVSFDLVFRATPIPEPATSAMVALFAILGCIVWFYRSNRSSWARRIPSALSSPVPKSSR